MKNIQIMKSVMTYKNSENFFFLSSTTTSSYIPHAVCTRSLKYFFFVREKEKNFSHHLKVGKFLKSTCLKYFDINLNSSILRCLMWTTQGFTFMYMFVSKHDEKIFLS